MQHIITSKLQHGETTQKFLQTAWNNAVLFTIFIYFNLSKTFEHLIKTYVLASITEVMGARAFLMMM